MNSNICKVISSFSLFDNLLKYKEFPRLTANRVNVRVLDQYFHSLNFLDDQVHSIKGMY